MKLRGWSVDRFGHLENRTDLGIGDHITVVWAPNETGKSTLHHFIRWVMLGFPAAGTLEMRRYRERGQRIGGRLHIEHNAQNLHLYRDSKARREIITTADGNPSGLQQADLVGPITLAAYNAVFGIGLDQIQNLDSMDQDAVREQIFAAGTVGGTGRSAAEAIADLDARLKHLDRRGGGFIAQVRGDLDRAAGELREAQDASARLPVLHGDLDRIEALAASLEVESTEVRAEDDHLARIQRLWPLWCQAMIAADELGRLPELADLGPDPMGRLDTCLDAVRTDRSRVTSAATELAGVRDQFDQLHPDEAIASRAATIDDALRHVDIEIERRRDLARRGAAARDLRRATEDRVADLGSAWTTTRLTGIDLSVSMQDRLRRSAAEVGHASNDLEITRRLHAESDADVAAADAELAAVSDCVSPVPARVNHATAPLRRPTPFVLVMTMASALIAALVAVGTGATGQFAVAAVATAFAVAGMVAAVALVRSRSQRPASDAAPAPSHLRRSAIEERRAALLDIRAERRRQMSSAEAVLGQVRQRWSDAVADAGLPADLRTSAVDGLLHAAVGIRTTLDGLDVEDARVQVLGDELDCAAADQVTALAGLGPEFELHDGASAQERRDVLVALAQRSLCARDELTRQRSLEEQLESMARRLDQARNELRTSEQHLADRFDAAGVDDETSYRQAVDHHERRTALLATVNDAEHRLRQSFGHDVDRARKELDLGRIEEWTTRRGALAARADAIGADLRRTHETRASVKLDLDAIERSADVVSRSMEVDRLTADLVAAGEEWAQLTLARDAVEATLGRFERERQPEVIRFASESFARVTGGRWTNIAAVDGSIEVLDDSGGRLKDSHLSRGATEQLYLCMRLGLARAHAGDHVALPLLLDDVLVNADAQRQGRLADELAAVSDQMQVLVFTAQRSTVDLLRQARSDTAIIELA